MAVRRIVPPYVALESTPEPTNVPPPLRCLSPLVPETMTQVPLITGSSAGSRKVKSIVRVPFLPPTLPVNTAVSVPQAAPCTVSPKGGVHVISKTSYEVPSRVPVQVPARVPAARMLPSSSGVCA